MRRCCQSDTVKRAISVPRAKFNNGAMQVARFRLAETQQAGSLISMEQEIDDFIRFLAVERGLSDNYQLSTAVRSRNSRPGARPRKRSRRRRMLLCR